MTNLQLTLCAAVLTLGMCLVACDGAAPTDAGVPTRVDSGPPNTPDAGPGGEDAGAPDAGPLECESGATRISACGFCGSQSEECGLDGTWMVTSACLSQGECAEGTPETETLAMCAQRQRLCLAGCSWGDWEMITMPGECEVGEMRTTTDSCPPGQSRTETCSASCGWEVTTACSDPCGGVVRTSPDYSSEVCVPAGPFIRGSTDYADTQPVVEVTLSAYYIDRYPVTNRRYRECYSMGACPRPSTTTAGNTFFDPARDDYPAQGLNHAAAMTFCAWDGGRRLPTEAEWEKAVRGPSPRTNDFPWDGSAHRCDLVYNLECGYRAPDFSLANDPYNGLPGSRSYYDTYLQWGGVLEWVSDYYGAAYYADPSSRSDPTGPATGTLHVSRGWSRAQGFVPLARRHQTAGSFRCARSAP